MIFVVTLDVDNNETLETALHDAAVAVRCKLRGIPQLTEFRYIDGSSVKVAVSEGES